MVYPLNAPLLDFLLLAIVNTQDSYGYQISQNLKELSNMKDSTLYPILKRLSDNDFVETYDRQFQGRNRKYYKITEQGKAQFSFLNEEWKQYTACIDHIISEGISSQNGGRYE